MAEVLYRIGAAAARHGWRVVAAWVVVLALAGGAYGLGHGTLSNNFDIPGTASAEVIDELQRELPAFAGGSGLVVLHTDDGSPFTAEQKAAYADLIARATTELPDVASVVDPFTTEQQRADRAAQVAAGRQQLVDGTAQLDAAQDQLTAGQEQLASAQEQLDAARGQAAAAGNPPSAVAELDAQQEQLDAQKTQLEAGRQQLDAQRTTLEAGRAQLDAGERLLDLASDLRLVSGDGSVAQVTVSFTQSRLTLSDETKRAVIDYFDGHPVDGVSVDYSSEIAQSVPELFGVGEAVGLAIAAVVLLVMLGSVLASALPIVTALAGVGIGVLAVLSFSGVVHMASITPVLGVMLGLAVGIDYSLFIINRHRRQLAHGMDLHESIALANGTAGNAVLFAGSTVIVALLALSITGVGFLGVMGAAGAVCVAIAVLLAVTATPAVLGLLGSHVLGRRGRARLERRTAPDTTVRPMSTRRAVGTIVAGVAVLLVAAVPVLSMRLGLPDGSSEPAGSTTYRASETVARAFGAGANASLVVTAHLTPGLDADQVTAAQLEIGTAIRAVGDVDAVAPVAVSEDGTLAAFQVKPHEGPNAPSTEALVRHLRAPDLLAGTTLAGGALASTELGVAGQAAINIDISKDLGDVLPLYLVVVVGLSLLIMIVVFRSLLVPVIATGGFVLSLLATYGAIVAVFQWGWLSSVFGVTTPGPVLSFLPVILVGILFGLAMDYQLFLASGVREAFVHGSAPRLAVVQGLRAGRAVVVAAALIMASVFGGFIFSESVIIRSVGFGLAVGVLLDAFVVRLLLMPALMHLLGRGAWWLPGWLDRLLPNVDIEGAALERRHHVPL